MPQRPLHPHRPLSRQPPRRLPSQSRALVRQQLLRRPSPRETVPRRQGAAAQGQHPLRKARLLPLGPQARLHSRRLQRLTRHHSSWRLVRSLEMPAAALKHTSRGRSGSERPLLCCFSIYEKRPEAALMIKGAGMLPNLEYKTGRVPCRRDQAGPGGSACPAAQPKAGHRRSRPLPLRLR